VRCRQLHRQRRCSDEGKLFHQSDSTSTKLTFCSSRQSAIVRPAKKSVDQHTSRQSSSQTLTSSATRRCPSIRPSNRSMSQAAWKWSARFAASVESRSTRRLQGGLAVPSSLQVHWTTKMDWRKRSQWRSSGRSTGLVGSQRWMEKSCSVRSFLPTDSESALSAAGLDRSLFCFDPRHNCGSLVRPSMTRLILSYFLDPVSPSD
jgi:hypothetical protein